jgi:hypothetical protein
MERNVGGLDRTVRAVLGVALLFVGVGAVRAEDRGPLLGALALIGSGALLFNASTGRCYGNAAFGIDTTDDEA